MLLVGGLYLTADFNQMWSKHVPLIGGLCHDADFDQIKSKHVPLDGGLHFATEFNHTYGSTTMLEEEVPTELKVLLTLSGTLTSLLNTPLRSRLQLP